MTRQPMTPEDHGRKIRDLHASLPHQTRHQLSVQRAVIETVRNPVVVRAVARGLRPLTPEKCD